MIILIIIIDEINKIEKKDIIFLSKKYYGEVAKIYLLQVQGKICNYAI